MRLFLSRFHARQLPGRLLVALLCAAMVGAGSVEAATLIVTNTADSGAGSLRDTIAAASDGDTIQFDAALNGQTINLIRGELAINKSITISGPGSNLLTVSRSSGTFRIFHVLPGQTDTIQGLTVRGGRGNGGGIRNDHATLSINNCTISENFSPDSGLHLGNGNGGGIYNDGSGSNATLTILGSTVIGNTAGGEGGGIYNDASNGGSAAVSLMNSIVSGNTAAFSLGPPGYAGGAGGGIYNYNTGGTLTITNSTVSNNQAGEGYPYGDGGGISNNFGMLTINNSAISGNRAAARGGGIYGYFGSVTITNSTVSGNEALGTHDGIGLGDGGGIHGDATITNCTISGNHASRYGGGFKDGATITNSTISGNWADQDGGGIHGFGNVTNSTISSNSAGRWGGGIYNGDIVTNCTISGNVATQDGGGLYNNSGSGKVTHCTLNGNMTSGAGGGIYNNASLQIENTILKAGTSGANIFSNGSQVTSNGYNLSSDDGGGFLTAPGDLINTNPLLGPLQDNGGPTFTHDLLAGSPAIDTGDPSFTPPPSTDQRGYARVFNGRVDIGSLEVQPTPPITISGTISYCSNPVPGPVPNVTLTLTGSGSDSTLSDSSGNYTFSSLAAGGSYTVTPTKAALPPGSAGINTVDVIAVQQHFTNGGMTLSGCRLTAADVNGDSAINTVDVIAIQRFILGRSTGIANVGKYQFTPASRMYTPLVADQTGQNYDTLVFGDVAAPFVE